MKLKPCPFCGGEAKSSYTSNGVDINIRCKCGISSRSYSYADKQKAIKAWNTRLQGEDNANKEI